MMNNTSNSQHQATAGNNQGLPAYAPVKMIQTHLAPVSKATLRNWVTRGWIRSLKIGDNRQSARLYSVRDTLEALDRLAAGTMPRRKKRNIQHN